MYVPQDVRDRLNEIQYQLIEQWHKRPAKIVGYDGRCRNPRGKSWCNSQVIFKSGKCPRCHPASVALRHPAMVFRLCGMTTAQDRDNQVQTLLDCMVSSGVLENDSIKCSNGWLAIAPATKGDKGCVINLHWEECASQEAADKIAA